MKHIIYQKLRLATASPVMSFVRDFTMGSATQIRPFIGEFLRRVKGIKLLFVVVTTLRCTQLPACEVNSQISKFPTLWLYQDQFYNIPSYIRVSVQTILCHSSREFPVEIVDEIEAVKLVADMLHPAFSRLVQGHKADYFRVSILIKYGGIYLDMDTIQLGNIKSLFQRLKLYHISGYLKQDDFYEILGSDILGPVRHQSILLKLWKVKADWLLTTRFTSVCNVITTKLSYPLLWTEMLSHMLVAAAECLLREKEINYIYSNGNNTYSQLTSLLMNQWPRSFKKETDYFRKNIVANLKMNSTFLIFHNSYSRLLEGEYFSWTNNDMLNANVLVGNLLKVAASMCPFRAQENYRGTIGRKNVLMLNP